MSQLHKALECLQPRDFGDVPLDQLESFLSDTFSKAELIANSVPPPPNGTPYESARRSRTGTKDAASLTDLTVSQVRRPVQADNAELQKAWGKPLKLSGKDASLGITVFKMAGHDRHGAWFARTSVHEGLGFAKWKMAMQREFPESLEVKGGPGEGNIRGIGGDRRLEEITVEGLGKLEVYQLSAQFPGPVAPREFITLLLTSENALSDASKVNNTIPRHYLVVSIPVTHPDAPAREGLVRGQYESVEMIREIPLPSDTNGEDDPETNPVEWIMITRSDPGGGIPRFMVERNTPSSIVQDAGKFLKWACGRDDFAPSQEDKEVTKDGTKANTDAQPAFAMSEANGILAGVGTSIVDDPRPTSFRRPSQRTMDNGEHDHGIIDTLLEKVEAYVPGSLLRTDSSSSISSGSIDSFASAQFDTADEGASINDADPGERSTSVSATDVEALSHNRHADRELEKLERKRQQTMARLELAKEKLNKDEQASTLRTSKELEKATEKHNRERKKQEEKYAKEIQKLEARRERETKKLLAKQQKEADKNNLLRMQKERDEWKERAELAEKEEKLLQDQILELQKENTLLVARLGKAEGGQELLKQVRDELNGKGRKRASSRASAASRGSKNSIGYNIEKEVSHTPSQLGTE